MIKVLFISWFLLAGLGGFSRSLSTDIPTTASFPWYTEGLQPNAGDSVPEPVAAPDLTLLESQYDFGKIPQGKPVTHVFLFKNTGNLPLALEHVQASCGCTTPEWNKDTIPPGGTSKIIVGYNAQNEGPFAKPVTLTYGDHQMKQIIIKGEVWKTPVNSAPLNSTVESLSNEQ